MALRGNLNDFSLPDVFQLVTFSRKTGVLRIKREDGAEGSVWFRDGEVFFAQSNWHTEMLGERLVRAQRITPQALRKGLEIRAAEGPDGRRLGAVLVDEGYIGEPVLAAFVQEQIQETIFDLMRWDEGEFDFEELPDIAEEDIGLSISIENVIMEGSRRLDEWSRIKKKIPSMDVVFKMATAPGEGTFEISLKPIEWNLLLLVDGTRSVAEMAHETRRTDFEVARIVYGLFSAGLLEFTGDEEVERLRAEKRERTAAAAQARAARRASEEAALAESAAQEAAREAAAQARVEADIRVAPPVAEPAKPVTPPQVEAHAEPLFLGTQLPGPTAEDAAVLEEMMGAVLERPAPIEVPPLPVEPAVPPAVEEVAPPAAEEVAPPAVEEVAQFTLEEAVPAVLAPTPVPEHAPFVAPVVPGLDLPLIPVLSAEDLMSDLSPLETPTQTLDEALSAVAEVASSGLIPEVVPPSVEAEQARPAETVVEPPVEPEPLAPIAEEPELVFLPVVAPPSVAPAEAEQFTPPEPVAPPEPTPAPVEQPEPTPVPVAELESMFEPVAQSEPTPEPVPGVPAPAANVSSYELELMSLGLGELPADLFGETSAAPAVSEPFSAGETPAAAAGGGTETPLDLGALLESLDREGEAAGPESTDAEPLAVPAGFDADILREVVPSEPASGVISTDAFMEDMSLEPIGLSGGLTDELSALTGARRPNRPVVNVAGIPDRSTGVLKRDQNVDKDTLLRIIDGIKNL